ncbi:MAG: T9SS type A sorting domain-containing protein [Flavobacteriia bacterium]|nr:T9SS type A sorting domain-containing protein [Flavobacteriia bacterium]
MAKIQTMKIISSKNNAKLKKGLVFAVIFLSFSCFSQQTINGTIMHDGILRSYKLYVPSIYNANTAVPLLFNFHGYTSNSNEQMIYGNFRNIADTANFLVVHPQGTLDVNNTTHFNVGWGGSSVDDVGFTEALLDSLLAAYSIDQNRIYAVGMSNGGFMSFRLACDLSAKIAAVGSVTGSMTPSTLGNCNATHPMPIIQIHGTTDPTVPYNGSAGWTASITNVLNHWATFNNCSSVPTVVNVPNTNALDGSTVEKYTYENGDNCSEVVHFKVTNGQHTWPGSIINLAGTNFDINASVEIWNFLSKYDIFGLINCNQATIEEQFVVEDFQVFPNPCSESIHVDLKMTESSFYEIYSLYGQLLKSGTISNTNDEIDLSNFEPQGYLLKIGDQYQRFIKL